MALVRIVASTFYARHDTMTPVRATVTAVATNIALKIFFVWGLHLGVAGIALGTAIGAWTNVGILTWSAAAVICLAIEKIFLHALPGSLLAALACGAGAWAGATLFQARGDVAALAAAILLCGPGLWRGAACVPQPPADPAHGLMHAPVRGPVRSGCRGAGADAAAGRRAGRALAGARAVAPDLALHRRGGWPRRTGHLDDALAGIDAPAFEMQLHGVGQFGNKLPHTLWAAARRNDMLEHLQRKVDNAIRRVGQPQDAHKFLPHVTLARLRNPELEKVRQWLTAHALYTSESFEVGAFCLSSSKLTSDGSIYRVEQEYPLRGFDGQTDD